MQSRYYVSKLSTPVRLPLGQNQIQWDCCALVIPGNIISSYPFPVIDHFHSLSCALGCTVGKDALVSPSAFWLPAIPDSTNLPFYFDLSLKAFQWFLITIVSIPISEPSRHSFSFHFSGFSWSMLLQWSYLVLWVLFYMSGRCHTMPSTSCSRPQPKFEAGLLGCLFLSGGFSLNWGPCARKASTLALEVCLQSYFLSCGCHKCHCYPHEICWKWRC